MLSTEMWLTCLLIAQFTYRSTFQSQLQHLISQHICSYADKVFRLLGTLTDSYPDVLGSLVPFIAEQISDIEQKKGGGNDDSLRLVVFFTQLLWSN